MDNIYVLIALNDGIEHSGTRAWGWYPTKELAEADIFADNNDLIFESGTFMYAAIEEVPSGFMGGLDDRKVWWYCAYLNEDQTYTIQKLDNPPDVYAGTVCIGMG